MAILRPAGDFDRSYEQDASVLRKPWHWVALIVGLLIVFTVPFWGNAYLVTTINRIAITVIALQGLSILTGYTGQVSLGQAAFMMVGGYISALIVLHLFNGNGNGFFIALPLAGLGTGVVGLIFGLPALRIKGFYLTMATLAAQFIIPWISRQIAPDYLGGTNGFIEVPVPAIGSTLINEPDTFYYISLVVVLITTVLVLNITRTRLGRALVAIRDNDLAAELLGVNLFQYKLRAFFIAAVFAGLAGALRAHSERGVGVEFGYDLATSIIFLGMLVIGGLGSNLGPFFGAAAVIFLEDFAELFGRGLSELFPAQSADLLTSFRPIFFGLVLMLFLIYEPRGLAHRWNLLKASWRLRPFAR